MGAFRFPLYNSTDKVVTATLYYLDKLYILKSVLKEIYI